MADEEKVNVNSLNREEMNKYAAEVGVEDPESYPNKDELAAAIAKQENLPTDTGAEAPAEGEQPAEAPAGEQVSTEPPKYEAIKAKDEDQNPVFIKVPKTPEEVAEEGTALAEAGAEATGGNVPFLEDTSDDPPPNKRIWAMDADHNLGLRQNPNAAGATKPDLVERGS